MLKFQRYKKNQESRFRSDQPRNRKKGQNSFKHSLFKSTANKINTLDLKRVWDFECENVIEKTITESPK